MNKRLLVVFLGLFLACDLLVSAYHYYNLGIDGDLPKIGLPYRWYEDVMQDPFGFDAVLNSKTYSGAGRYMCHWWTVFWMHNVYGIIFSFVKNPIVSIYLCTTAIAMMVHLFFVILVWRYVSVVVTLSRIQSLIVLCIATIFIQYGNYYHSFGIIDRSPSYIFFYALQLLFFALWAFPFFTAYHKNKFTLHPVIHLFWVFFSVYLAFSSVLTQPVWFVVCLLMFIAYVLSSPSSLWRQFLLSKTILFHFVWFLLICIYAFYVSKFNNEKTNVTTLSERYLLLLKGIYYWMFYSPVIPIVLCWLGLNFFLIHRFFNSITWNFFKYQAMWIGLFVFCYIVLLPMGGYRSYRPFIIRYDTIMPVTLGLIYLIASSSVYLLKNIVNRKFNIYYGICLIGIGLIFTNADKDLELNSNDCQHQVMYYLYQSTDTLVPLPTHCNVGTWNLSDYNEPVIIDMLTSQYKVWGILKPYQQLYIRK